jgi:hypothetical protein
MTLVFFDTNLIIALCNPHDRLHETASKLAENEDVCILSTVEREAKATFLRKFNTAMLEVYKVLNKGRGTEDELQLQEVIVKGFKALIKSRPDHEPFYKYIFGEIKGIGITLDNLSSIPKVMNERAVKITTAIASSTERSEDLNPDSELHKKVETAIKGVKFKDFIDFEIFCEACSIKINEDIVILTNDSEFYKKSRTALNILKSMPEFKGRKIEVKKVK